jgi:hypothetical protein
VSTVSKAADDPDLFDPLIALDELLGEVGLSSADTGGRADRRALAEALLADADIVVNNHRGSKLERLGLDPRELAERHPGLISVPVLNRAGASSPSRW